MTDELLNEGESYCIKCGELMATNSSGELYHLDTGESECLPADH